MGDAEVWKLLFDGIIAAGVIGGLIVTLLKLGAIGNQIETHGKAIEKMADVIVMQATQKTELAGLRERQTQDAARTDETFRRVFALIDQRKAS